MNLFRGKYHLIWYTSFLLILSCYKSANPKKSQINQIHHGSYLQGQYNFQNDSSASNFFVAFIDTDGTIYIENSVVTEEQFLIKAREALNKSEKTSAILFVQSSIIQGIHLSAQLSKIGFRTVEVFYPTATNR